MGEVFLAQDTKLERSVALKLMSAELASDPNQRKRFRTEARAASALTHPNICVIHEVGETEDGRPFLAMEFVEGQTLDILIQQRRLKIREILRLGAEVAEALDAAHSRGIVHRDIKPANIMLDRRARAKVLDFGLAKRFAKDDLGQTTTSLAQTHSGSLIGTPHYMSPEQALGRDVDERTDIFSLGVVLYELVTGQRPFLGRTVGETINNVVNQPPGPLGLENPRVTPALDSIIFKCLQKDPANRYSTAKALDEDLTRLRTELERQDALPRENLLPKPLTPVRPPVPSANPALVSNLSPRRARPKVAFALLATAGCVALWLGFKHWTGPATSDIKAAAANVPFPNSVAVLPFDNFSGEPDTDYLSDGLTEEITTALARIQGLKVAARNSAFSFKGKRRNAQEVGRSLGVSTLLEGSVRKAGKQLRVTAQLISVSDGFQLWSETYDRTVDDILGVQDDIGRRIAERLQGKTSTAYVASKTMDPEAHKLYLQGLSFWNQRTASGLKKAAELFQEAIAKDPGYAQAHAGLAATYYLLPLYSVGAIVAECRALSLASANRALELDLSCAEAHAVLGSLQDLSRNFEGAEAHFRRAIQLAPNYATAHQWYGRVLTHHGRRDEGMAELKIALDLDPLSPIIRSSICEAYFEEGDVSRAIAETRKVIEAFPDFPAARGLLIAEQVKKGLFKEALAQIDQVRALQPDEPLAQLEMRGYALARLGQTTEAEKILELLGQHRNQGRHVDGAIGFVYLGLRDYDKALDAFEKVVAYDGLDMEVLCDPFFEEVRHLPRFQALLRKAGFTG